MKKYLISSVLILSAAVCFAHPKAKKAPRHPPVAKMSMGVNPYPIQSINGDTTPAQRFITNNAATAYITSNGAGVTTFYFPTEGAGSGSVTSVSVASANGLAGSVANPTTTPAITLSTTISGLLKGNGTAISAQTTGSLSDGTSDGISVGGGTGAVLGSGTTITQQAASISSNGYLTSGDWSTFNAKAPTANPTFTGTANFSTISGYSATVSSTLSTQDVTSGNCYLSPKQSNLGNSGSSVSVDLSTATLFTITLNAATPVVALSNPKPGCAYAIVMTQDSAGSRVPSFSGLSVLWGNNSHTLSTTGLSVDAVNCFYNGLLAKLLCNLVTGYQ